jgi:hypothetical protein
VPDKRLQGILLGIMAHLWSIPQNRQVCARERQDMSYFIDLFSPETYDAFSRSARDTSGRATA